MYESKYFEEERKEDINTLTAISLSLWAIIFVLIFLLLALKVFGAVVKI